jgi:hypothetical protein
VWDFKTCSARKAIIDASEADPAYARFDNDVVRSSIHYAFWHGACMYDVFQAMLTTEVLKCSEIQRGNQNGNASFAAQLEAQVAMSFWAVLILVFETCMSLDRRAASVWNLHTSSYIAKSAWTLLRGKCSQSH